MKLVSIDVSSLPAPEPLQKIFEALNQLSGEQFLKVNHRKQPLLLYRPLTQQGYSFHVQPGKNHAYDIFIWKSIVKPPENLVQPNLAISQTLSSSQQPCNHCEKSDS